MKNYILVLLAQFVALLTGVIKIAFIPYILGVEAFGYWQMYLLYVGYLGVLSLGFNDGIVVKYGSFKMEELPKDKMKSSILLFIFVQVIWMCLLLIMLFFEVNDKKQIVFLFVIGNVLLTGLSGITTGILQITNNLKRYSLILVIDKVLSIIIYICLFYLNLATFINIIIVDLISKLVSCICSIYFCKEIFLEKNINLRSGLEEFLENIKIGIKIMLSNLMGMLTIGCVLFFIERTQQIEQFSIISFGMSTTNIIILFASSLAVLIYPFISRKSFNENKNIHLIIKEGITIILYIFLLGFFPIKYIIENYLNTYIQVLDILPILFVYVIYESKINIIINSYFKSLRLETLILKFNLIFLVTSTVITSFVIKLGASMILLFVCITLNIMIKYLFMEKVIFNTFENDNKLSVAIIDILFIILFLMISYQERILWGFVSYAVVLATFVFVKRQNLIDFYKYVIIKS